MSQRLSRQRAEERQAAEEVRKMYSEEDLEDGGGALEEEEEAELTDADTTGTSHGPILSIPFQCVSKH